MSERSGRPIPGTVGTGSGRGQGDGLAGRLETGAFFLLLLIVASRPLLSETFESGIGAMHAVLGDPQGITPATTAWFDLGIWVAAVLAAGAVVLRRGTWRLTGLEPGGAVLLAAAIISTLATSNRRVAINASADWLTALVLIMVLANVVRDRLRVRLLLCVVAASSLASAGKCVSYRLWEMSDTLAIYEEEKAEFWSRQGVALDDPQVELFERRMRATEATGFFPYGNAAGALLMLGAFAAVAVATMCRPRSPGQAGSLLLAGVLFACMPLTGARGAMMAGGAGLMLYAVLWKTGGWLRARWRLSLAGVWVCIVVATLVVIGYGVARGGLPGASLTFRWNYWQVTAEMLRDRMWTGTGAMNFDHAYLLYKPIDYPEEIKDPHNLVVSVVAQWGLLGGAGLLLAMIGASRVLAGRWGEAATPAEGDLATERCESVQQGTSRSLRLWIGAVTGGFLVFRVVLLSAYLGTPSGLATLYLDLTMFCVLLWAPCFALLMLASKGSTRRSFRLACLCAVAAFLLANTIDFSIFFPGTLTPFAALASLLWTGVGPASTVPLGPRRGSAALVLSLAGLAVFGWLVLLPVSAVSSHLAAARASAGMSTSELTAAAAADPLDPTPPLELARRLANPDDLAGINAALEAVEEARRRDPADAMPDRMRSELLEWRFRQTDSQADLMAAISARQSAVEKYWASPDEHQELGELLERAAWQVESEELAGKAIGAYQMALQLNAARPGLDEARKWKPARVDDLRARIAALESRFFPPIFAGVPATAAAPAD